MKQRAGIQQQRKLASMEVGGVLILWLMMSRQVWSTLTPALSPRRGSAEDAFEKIVRLGRVFRATRRGEKISLRIKPQSRTLSSGERAGVMASVLHLSTLAIVKRLRRR